jgi:GTPase SAR1 family protein
MNQANHPEIIQALGKIAACKNEVQGMATLLEALPLWRPGAALKKECREILDLMDDHERRFERKLMVAVIGPGGSGKSTLVNSLAGVDGLSDAGTRRPTTTEVVLVCRSSGDAAFLDPLFNPEDLRVIVEPGAFQMDHLLLVDTPDIDSTHQAVHRPLVKRVIEMADVLLCVFNSENPKTRDQVDFFHPYVQRFHGESLLGILNKCDRVDERELKEVILPDFKQHIAKAWERPMASFFCISARRHLKNPAWDVNAGPKHAFDQYDELKDLLTGAYNLPGAIADRRYKNVQELRKFAQFEVQKAIRQCQTPLAIASARMKKAEKAALKEAFEALRNEGTGQVLGVNVLLYQKLAQQWFGPVGWLIALWARILIFGTGLMALFRFGNPVRQIMGIISSLRHFKEAEASIAAGEKGNQLGAAMRKYRVAVLKEWPEIAEMLVRGGFEESVRHPDSGMSDQNELNEALSTMWQETLGATIEKTARRFSGMWLQILFNIPAVGMLAHIAWLTVKHYFAQDYLATDFFVHAFLTAGIVMFLSFFLLQACLRMVSGPERIMTRAFEGINIQLDPLQRMSIGPVFQQLDKLLGANPVHPEDVAKSTPDSPAPPAGSKP